MSNPGFGGMPNVGNNMGMNMNGVNNNTGINMNGVNNNMGMDMNAMNNNNMGMNMKKLE